jgi:hypothetical protein
MNLEWADLHKVAPSGLRISKACPCHRASRLQHVDLVFDRVRNAVPPLFG